MNPRINFDKALIDNKDYILGIDEVGWGCVAGPVILGGCLVKKEFYAKYLEIMNTYPLFEQVRDSKKLRENKRKEMFSFLESYQGKELYFFTGMATAEYINDHRLAKAYTLSFDSIIESVKKVLTQDNLDNVKILIDGNRDPKSLLVKDFTLIIKGDDQSMSISLASLYSKEYRDEYMRQLEKLEEFRPYEFSKNKGYGTTEHSKLIKEFGISSQHRREASTRLIED